MELVLTVVLAAVLVAIWILLGVVCWIFWKAKKREDAERAEGDAWKSARSF